jgi:hypothetical protein
MKCPNDSVEMLLNNDGYYHCPHCGYKIESMKSVDWEYYSNLNIKSLCSCDIEDK